MIIGVTGFPRAGKDTIADYLVSEYGFVKASINMPMRLMLSALNPMLFDGIHVQEALKQHGYEQTKNLYPEYRRLLQKLGKEASRDIFGEDFWINMAIERAQQYKDVVFNDVRFANEATRIQSNNGRVIKVFREGTEPVNAHASDVGVPDCIADYKITNDSIHVLYWEIDECMKSLEGSNT